MSQHRSSSAVRNLRSLFENKANENLDDHDARGRSPSSARLSVSDANGRPLSKVRSSFINVQHPTMSSESPPPMPASAAGKRASAFETRTESFSTNAFSKEAVSALKQEVQEENTRRQSHPALYAEELTDEGAMESTTNTPAVEPREDEAMGVIDHAAAKLTEMELPPPNEEEEEQTTEPAPASDSKADAKDENEPPANPDKPITGAEEEKGSMKPALPDSEDTVSGGQGLPPVAEDLRTHNKTTESTPSKDEQQPQSTATPRSVNDAKSTPQKKSPMSPRSSHKPEPVSTGSPQKAAENNLKSPISERKSSSSAKSPLSPLGAPKTMDRKASRSSLTAPTAASSARERRESSSVKPAAATNKRESTKAANISSHLTAPTAASRARTESDSSKPASSTGRPSISARAPPKQQVSTSKPAAPRHSTTGSDSRQPAPRKNTTSAAPSESFLERMMRPTAASASKTHEKVSEQKTTLPQRTKSSAKAHSAPKTNGAAKPAPKSGSVSKPVHHAKPAQEKPAEKDPENVAVAPEEEKSGQPAETNGKAAEPTEIPDIPIPPAENGNATPKHNTDESQPAGAALESTPAFGEDEIR